MRFWMLATALALTGCTDDEPDTETNLELGDDDDDTTADPVAGDWDAVGLWAITEVRYPDATPVRTTGTPTPGTTGGTTGGTATDTGNLTTTESPYGVRIAADGTWRLLNREDDDGATGFTDLWEQLENGTVVLEMGNGGRWECFPDVDDFDVATCDEYLAQGGTGLDDISAYYDIERQR